MRKADWKKRGGEKGRRGEPPSTDKGLSQAIPGKYTTRFKKYAFPDDV
jgi:hypothetical protein